VQFSQEKVWKAYNSDTIATRDPARARMDEVRAAVFRQACWLVCPWHCHTLRNAQVFDYAKSGIPRKHGDHWYMYHNSGLQNQYVLYKLAGEGE